MDRLPRVLLVDDQRGIRAALRRILVKAGFEVVVAASGEEALLAIRQEDPFDLVITDLQMPNMHGTEFIPIVRACAPDVAIVVLTGHRDSQRTTRLFEQGVVACLDKPVEGEVIVATLRSIVAEAVNRQVSFPK